MAGAAAPNGCGGAGTLAARAVWAARSDAAQALPAAEPLKTRKDATDPMIRDYRGPFRARCGAAMVPRVVLHAEASATASIGGFAQFRSGETAGIGDHYVAPVQLNWTLGNHHFTVSPGIHAPTGRYRADRVLNTGRNQWGFDLAEAYTLLDPQHGRELPFTAGYLIIKRTDATRYRYDQITDDSGQRPAGSGGFRGSGVGIGPALPWTPRIGARDVSLIAKWIHDIDTRNRFEGDLVMVSAAFRF
jgi:hypothetical protein